MILSVMPLVESCPVLGDFGGSFYNVFAYFYGIPTISNWCLVRLEGQVFMHFLCLSK